MEEFLRGFPGKSKKSGRTRRCQTNNIVFQEFLRSLRVFIFRFLRVSGFGFWFLVLTFSSEPWGGANLEYFYEVCVGCTTSRPSCIAPSKIISKPAIDFHSNVNAVSTVSRFSHSTLSVFFISHRTP